MNLEISFPKSLMKNDFSLELNYHQNCTVIGLIILWWWWWWLCVCKVFVCVYSMYVCVCVYVPWYMYAGRDTFRELILSFHLVALLMFPLKDVYQASCPESSSGELPCLNLWVLGLHIQIFIWVPEFELRASDFPGKWVSTFNIWSI